MSPITLSLITAASAVYPDGLIADHLNAANPDGFQLPEDMPGDTLARFVAMEIAEVTQGEDDAKVAAGFAADAIERAAAQLLAVVIALRKAEAGDETPPTLTPQERHAKKRELTRLETVFAAAGGRGVESSDEINALRAELGED